MSSVNAAQVADKAAALAASRKAERRAAAANRASAATAVVAARVAKRDTRTPEAQLTELDNRLGVNVGATRERARLAALMAA